MSKPDSIQPGYATRVHVGNTMRGDTPVPVIVTLDDGRIWRVHVGTAFIGVDTPGHAYAVALAWVDGMACRISIDPIQKKED